MIANSKILYLLFSNLDKKDANIVFAILFVFYQLMPWEDTRRIILSMDDLIKIVLRCLKGDNNKIVFICLNFLEIVSLYDQENKW